jgi:hypothetical protein
LSPLVAACLAAPLTLVAAQVPGTPRDKEPPSQTKSRMREQQIALTVSGCVRGSRFLLSSSEGTAAILDADQLLLEGPKELMQQLRKEHEGHEDELTGTAFLKPPPDGSTTTDVQSKPLGKKGRLTVGVRQSDSVAGSVKQPVRFRVASMRHLHESCARLD